MEPKKLQTGERGLSYILIILSLFSIYEAVKISGTKLTSSSPGAFPLFISTLLLIMGIWIWGEKRTFSPIHYSNYGDKLKALGKQLFSKNVLVIIFYLIIYSVILDKVGFTVATFMFLWVGISFLTSGNWVKNLGISFLSLSTILIIFKLIFKVILP